MRHLARTACAGTLAAGLLLVTPCLADGGDADVAAQALFDEGRRLFSEGHLAEACEKFAASKRLDPGIGVTLQLGDCYERLGRMASAWAQYRDAEDMARHRADARAELAHRRAEAVERRLCRLTIIVPQASRVAGLEVRQDGELIAAERTAVPIPIDPGRHVIVAAAPGRRSWTATIDARAEGCAHSVAVPLLESDSDTEPAPVIGDHPSLQRTLGWATFGLGGAALVVGTYFGVRAKSKDDSSNSDGHCIPTACDETGARDRRDALSAATASTIVFAVGAAAVVGGLALVLTAPSSRRSAVVAIGLRGPGIALDTTF